MQTGPKQFTVGRNARSTSRLLHWLKGPVPHARRAKHMNFSPRKPLLMSINPYMPAYSSLFVGGMPARVPEGLPRLHRNSQRRIPVASGSSFCLLPSAFSFSCPHLQSE
jgi:hypothetical protein